MGAPKHTERRMGPPTGGNDIVDVYATAIVDKEAVTSILGMDPAIQLIVVEVKVAPKADNKITIDRDSFTLLSGRDGQKSQPLEPGQIAGRGSMRVTSVGASSGGMMGNNRGPVWGGIPGTGGSPARMPGNGAEGGSGTAGVTEAKATINNGTGEKDNPLLQVLKAKILPEKETNEPVSGLLYFIFDGKPPKLKDLTLIYKNPGGRLMIDLK
jgi:hypothetical protein